MNLRAIHWDILKLIRTLCYEGLPETRMAVVDSRDCRLPRWEPNPHNATFVLPDGAPEPLVRACFSTVAFEESKHRWGKEGRNVDPALQYLIDRVLLNVSNDDWPICTAFRNCWNDAEVFCTIRFEEDEYGQFYVWQTPFRISVLREKNGALVTSSPYRVFKLTERVHELLDDARGGPGSAEEDNADPPAGHATVASTDVADSESTQRKRPSAKRGRKVDTDPKEDKRIADAWASGLHDSFADLERILGLKEGDAKLAMDRHRKRK